MLSTYCFFSEEFVPMGYILIFFYTTVMYINCPCMLLKRLCSSFMSLCSELTYHGYSNIDIGPKLNRDETKYLTLHQSYPIVPDYFSIRHTHKTIKLCGHGFMYLVILWHYRKFVSFCDILLIGMRIISWNMEGIDSNWWTWFTRKVYQNATNVINIKIKMLTLKKGKGRKVYLHYLLCVCVCVCVCVWVCVVFPLFCLIYIFSCSCVWKNRVET